MKNLLAVLVATASLSLTGCGESGTSYDRKDAGADVHATDGHSDGQAGEDSDVSESGNTNGLTLLLQAEDLGLYIPYGLPDAIKGGCLNENDALTEEDAKNIRMYKTKKDWKFYDVEGYINFVGGKPLKARQLLDFYEKYWLDWDKDPDFSRKNFLVGYGDAQCGVVLYIEYATLYKEDGNPYHKYALKVAKLTDKNSSLGYFDSAVFPYIKASPKKE